MLNSAIPAKADSPMFTPLAEQDLHTQLTNSYDPNSAKAKQIIANDIMKRDITWDKKKGEILSKSSPPRTRNIKVAEDNSHYISDT